MCDYDAHVYDQPHERALCVTKVSDVDASKKETTNAARRERNATRDTWAMERRNDMVQ